MGLMLVIKTQLWFNQPMSHFLNLGGKKALICGASQGIGEACARLFAEAGAEITMIARRQSDLDRVSRELAKVPQGQHRSLTLDLANTDLIETQISPLLPFDIVVHNVAGPKAGPMLEAGLSDLQEALSLHLFSAQTIAKLCLPGMKAKRWGRWINIISTSVKVPLPNLGVSNTVRGAMASWSKTMANEWASSGVTFNNVLPGFTRTPRFESLKKTAAQNQGQSLDQVEAQWISQIPMKRIGEAHEIASAVLFLASHEAAYVNGVSLPVDGGRTPSL
jgi:3-oxoacyl-[acyl-carrier protein] reductase